MFKQSPSRNHKSKGIKTKHILQICVLVVICFWLLYQVKHSHEKRKEFESKDENSVLKLQSASELQRFGRKDIPRVTEITTNVEKHEEDEDDKEDEEDKENKHEEDDMNSEDVRVLEREEEREGGDDEIDEHEPEKIDEEEGNEDKEREERESVTEEGHSEEEEEEEFGQESHTESQESDDVDKEDHREQEITSDNHDHVHDRDSDRDVKRNNRAAQEQLYRADDASSEVAQNIQSISQESRNDTMGQANEIYGKINFGQEHETKTSEKVDQLMKPDIQLKEDVSLNRTTSSVTINKLKNDKVNLTKADDSSLQNSTLPESPNNSTVIKRLSGSLLSNNTQTKLDSNSSENGTIGIIKQATDDNNQKDSGKDANNIENTNANKTIATSNATNNNEPTKPAKGGLIGNGSEDEKPEDTEKAGMDEKSKSQSLDDRLTVEHDPIDASDIVIEEDSRADFNTLPEIRSEVHGTENEVARLLF